MSGGPWEAFRSSATPTQLSGGDGPWAAFGNAKTPGLPQSKTAPLVDPQGRPQPEPQPQTPEQIQRGALRAVGNRLVDFTLGNLGAIGDMVLSLPAQAVAVGADIGTRMHALVQGETDKRTTGIAARQAASTVTETLGNPLQKLMSWAGLGEHYEGSDVTKAMGALSRAIEAAGGTVEKATNGALNVADVQSLVDTFMLSLGGRGAEAAKKRFDEARDTRMRGLEKKDRRGEEIHPDFVVPEGIPPELRTGEGGVAAPARLRRPVQGSGVMGDPAAQAVDPALRTGEGAAGVRDPRRPTAPPPPAPPRIDPALGLGEGARSSRDPNRPTQGPSDVEGTKGISDRGMMLGVGGAVTAAALIDQFGGSSEESQVAKAGGALIGLAALHAMPDKAPLSAMRDRSEYTLKTLERLPQNRYEFTREQVMQQLNRQDVTKAERDAVMRALGDRETITAKELAVGVKEATGDFELKPDVRTDGSSYETYGLDRIDRAAPDPMDHFDPETLTEAREIRPGTWAVEDQFGDNAIQVTASSSEEAIRLARQRVEDSKDVEQSARTTVYQSPIELGGANHFSDPNYFAHTRSFDEGGVRHVVEIQSDLAQKVGRVFSPEEIAALESEGQKLTSRIQELETFLRGGGALRMQELMKERKSAVSPEWREFTAKADEAKRELRELKVRQQEVVTKIQSSFESQKADPVRPILKDWWKRIIREEMAQAAVQRGDPSSLIAHKEAEIADLKKNIGEAEKPAPWVGDKVSQTRWSNAAYDLDVLAMDLKNGHVSEGTAREYMLKTEQQLPPEARSRWKNYYETYADETEGFLRPGKGEEGAWGSKYASNFPKGMAEFLKQELGKGKTDWMTEAIRGFEEDIARIREQGRIRFATADTVAKVEGWPDGRANTEARLADLERQRLAAMRGEYTRGGVRPDIALSQIEDLIAHEKSILEEMRPGRNFTEAHQGIYDRYKKDVEKFLRNEFKAREYTDELGHTWLEVDLPEPKGGRIAPKQMFGGIDKGMLGFLASAGIGAGVVALMTEGDDPKRAGKVGQGALVGALAGLAAMRFSKNRGIAEVAQDAIQTANDLTSSLSYQLEKISQPITRALRGFEMNTLKGTHDRLQAITPFVDSLRELPAQIAPRVAVALFNGKFREALDAIPAERRGRFSQDLATVRNLLNDIRLQAIDVGLMTRGREDYFPRRVADLEGLYRYLQQEGSTTLTRAVDARATELTRKNGRPPNVAEQAMLTNEVLEDMLRGRIAFNRPSYMKGRSIEQLRADMLKYYEPPAESLINYTMAVTHAVERARFFGKNAVKDGQGRLDLESSIGNVVAEELRSGRLDAAQQQEAVRLLRIRFEQGDAAMGRFGRAVLGATNTALLANPFSALQNLGDVAGTAAVMGMVPTVRALQAMLTRSEGVVRPSDVGLADVISAEFVGTGSTPVQVAGRRLSMARFTDRMMTASGFKALDAFGKSVTLNAAMKKAVTQMRTPKGEADFNTRQAGYFGRDLDALKADLRAGRQSPLVREYLFRELSDMQPVSKSEMPASYLKTPQLRLLFQMKSYAIKQLTLARQRGVDQIRAGNFREGAGFLLRYGLMVGAAGASLDFIINWMLGRDDHLEWGDIPLNVLKNWGLSKYVIEKAQDGKLKEALGNVVSPAAGVMFDIAAKPGEAARYIPVIGKYIYNQVLTDDEGKTGAERYNEREAKRKERKEAMEANK